MKKINILFISAVILIFLNQSILAGDSVHNLIGDDCNTTMDFPQDVSKNYATNLIIIRLQRDCNDPVNGIPDNFLDMLRAKTVTMREAINKELIKRGVSSI